MHGRMICQKIRATHRYILRTCLASRPIFRPLSAAIYSLATFSGIGFLPCARNLAQPAAVRDIAANPCWAWDSLGMLVASHVDFLTGQHSFRAVETLHRFVLTQLRRLQSALERMGADIDAGDHATIRIAAVAAGRR